MKQKLPLLALAGILLSGFVANTVIAKDSPPASRVEVSFDHPEKFRDIRESRMDTDRGREAIMDDLRSYLTTKATAQLPEGQKLSLTFTEIDLAGEFEEWRRPPADNVRVVKDLYPPRLDFTWEITDASGASVRKGSEQLRDMGFMSRLVIDRGDPLRYEKDMLQDWMRANLRPKSK